jgi:hypothetical protein
VATWYAQLVPDSLLEGTGFESSVRAAPGVFADAGSRSRRPYLRISEESTCVYPRKVSTAVRDVQNGSAVSGEPMNTESRRVSLSVILVRRREVFQRGWSGGLFCCREESASRRLWFWKMPHQRRPIGFLGRCVGFGDETGATEIDGRLLGMPGLGPSFAVRGHKNCRRVPTL